MHKLLLVEDEEYSYDMLTSRLENQGYAVDLATTGEEAVDKAGAATYDLILMDIRLPGIDGYEAIRRIREQRGGGGGNSTGGISIIALTAHALEEDREKALAAGCDDYHAKPVHFTKLVEQIEERIGQNTSSA